MGAAGAVLVPLVMLVSVAWVLTPHDAVSAVVRLGGPVPILSQQRGASHDGKVKSGTRQAGNMARTSPVGPASMT
jgi:hypothetical protein